MFPRIRRFAGSFADVVEEIFLRPARSRTCLSAPSSVGWWSASMFRSSLMDACGIDLALTLPIDELNALLRGQKIPETWFGECWTRRILAARLPHPELFVGNRGGCCSKGSGRGARDGSRRQLSKASRLFRLEPFRPVSLGCSNRHTEGCADGAVYRHSTGPVVGRPDGGCDRCRARLSVRVLDRAAACPAAAARAGALLRTRNSSRAAGRVSVRSISSMNTCARRRIPSAISGRISRC